MLAVSQETIKAQEDPNFCWKNKLLYHVFLCTCTDYITTMHSVWPESRFLELGFL